MRRAAKELAQANILQQQDKCLHPNLFYFFLFLCFLGDCMILQGQTNLNFQVVFFVCLFFKWAPLQNPVELQVCFKCIRIMAYVHKLFT